MCQYVFEFKNKILNSLKLYEISINPIIYKNRKALHTNFIKSLVKIYTF
jgi:hypothetical protein